LKGMNFAEDNLRWVLSQSQDPIFWSDVDKTWVIWNAGVGWTFKPENKRAMCRSCFRGSTVKPSDTCTSDRHKKSWSEVLRRAKINSRKPENIVKHRLYGIKWRQLNKKDLLLRKREYWLKKRFGLSLGSFEFLTSLQGDYLIG